MNCPVCKFSISPIPVETIDGEQGFMPDYLYQYSYKGEQDYISPRCCKCYDKAKKKLDKKERRKYV